MTDDYIRRAYYIYTGLDIRRLPDLIQQAFACLPPDPEWHDFSGDFSEDDMLAIRQRHQDFGMGYDHDYTSDCTANRQIDDAVAALPAGNAGVLCIGPHIERELHKQRVLLQRYAD